MTDSLRGCKGVVKWWKGREREGHTKTKVEEGEQLRDVGKKDE